MSGQELEDHRVELDGDIVGESELPDDPLVITVDPFVPSRYDADSFDGIGSFPTMTLMHTLGADEFPDFMSDLAEANARVAQVWPQTQTLFEYYLDANWSIFEKTARSKFELTEVGVTRHERSTLAYQTLAYVTVAVVGTTGERGAKVFDRYSRKHLAGISKDPYLALLRIRDADSKGLERDVFSIIGHFIDNFPSWSMGRLARFADAGALDDLTLYRDEFTLVRDLYQQGFELACKCLWVLVAAQNTVKRSDPNLFGDHPASVPVKQRANSISQFDKLPNAYKIAYVAQVPGWDSLSELLNNQRRNAIGHASARHDLRAGRVVSDKDLAGISYLEFLNETHGVFEALSSLMQVLRTVRVAASPDFRMNATVSTS